MYLFQRFSNFPHGGREWRRQGLNIIRVRIISNPNRAVIKPHLWIVRDCEAPETTEFFAYGTKKQMENTYPTNSRDTYSIRLMPIHNLHGKNAPACVLEQPSQGMYSRHLAK